MSGFGSEARRVVSCRVVSCLRFVSLPIRVRRLSDANRSSASRTRAGLFTQTRPELCEYLRLIKIIVAGKLACQRASERASERVSAALVIVMMASQCISRAQLLSSRPAIDSPAKLAGSRNRQEEMAHAWRT